MKTDKEIFEFHKKNEFEKYTNYQEKEKIEDFIQKSNTETSRKLEVLRASGLSDEVITILAPMLLSYTAEVKNLAKSKSKK
jgi:hypothetical protein